MADVMNGALETTLSRLEGCLKAHRRALNELKADLRRLEAQIRNCRLMLSPEEILTEHLQKSRTPAPHTGEKEIQ